MPTILLLNHYLPPDPAPTSRLLGELGDHLETHGWDVIRICGVDPEEGYRTRSSHGKIQKLLGWLAAHCRILRKSLRAPRADIVLCLSDPPFLIITASIIALFHRARLAHWVMDLYPDLAHELGELPRFFCRLIGPAMRVAYRSCDLTIALDSAMSDRLRASGNRSLATVPPWVLSTTQLDMPTLQTTRDNGLAANNYATSQSDGTAFTWLYSGNLGRAHIYEPLLQIQSMLESDGQPAHLVFQGGGAQRSLAQKRAEQLGLKRCEFRDYAPDGELLVSLLSADVLIATLAEPLAGMLWPSKLALLKHLDRPVLWVGPPGDIAAMCVNRSPPGLAICSEQSATAAEWLASLIKRKAPLSGPGIRLPSLCRDREESLSLLRKLLGNTLPPGRHSSKSTPE
jgi:hypothetical protein